MDSALLAVELYNKPRTAFRTEAFITMMVIAWTRLFHAYFNSTIGARYYYKKKNGRYEIVDGERKAWDLATCIKKYGKLKSAVDKKACEQIAVLIKDKKVRVEAANVNRLKPGQVVTAVNERLGQEFCPRMHMSQYTKPSRSGLLMMRRVTPASSDNSGDLRSHPEFECSPWGNLWFAIPARDGAAVPAR